MAFAARRSAPLGAAVRGSASQRVAAVARPACVTESVRYGANLKEIRSRIASVTNMVKITGTMKMIASARLAPAQRKLDRARPFVEAGLSATAEAQPLETSKKTAIVAVTTDRGLCGGVNTFGSRKAKELIEEIKQAGGEPYVFLIGDKGAGSIGREMPQIVTYGTEDMNKVPPTFAGVALLADLILKENPDQVKVVYNRFQNAAQYETEAKTTIGFEALLEQDEIFDEYEWEEDEKQAHMQDLTEYLVAINLWGAISENATTELAQRMTAMDNANRNAKDMKQALNVKYNRTRQAAITTELTEIISGAAAIE